MGSPHAEFSGSPTASPSWRRLGDAEERRAERSRLGLGEGPVLLLVGRLIRHKGAGDVIGVLPSLAKRFSRPTLVLLGDGSAPRGVGCAGGVARRIAGGPPSRRERPHTVPPGGGRLCLAHARRGDVQRPARGDGRGSAVRRESGARQRRGHQPWPDRFACGTRQSRGTCGGYPPIAGRSGVAPSDGRGCRQRIRDVHSVDAMVAAYRCLFDRLIAGREPVGGWSWDGEGVMAEAPAPLGRLRLVHCCGQFSANQGGTERQARAVCEALAARGHRISVLTLRGREPAPNVPGVSIHARIRTIDRGRLFGITYAASATAALLQEVGTADCLHAHHLYLDALAALLAGRIRRRPVVAEIDRSGGRRGPGSVTAHCGGPQLAEALPQSGRRDCAESGLSGGACGGWLSGRADPCDRKRG